MKLSVKDYYYCHLVVLHDENKVHIDSISLLHDDYDELGTIEEIRNYIYEDITEFCNGYNISDEEINNVIDTIMIYYSNL